MVKVEQWSVKFIRFRYPLGATQDHMLQISGSENSKTIIVSIAKHTKDILSTALHIQGIWLKKISPSFNKTLNLSGKPHLSNIHYGPDQRSKDLTSA